MNKEKETNANLSQTVYDYIMKMLLKQEIKCGEKISEENISERLNISRTPIREALRLLASQGLLVIYPKRFAEVVTFSENDKQQIGIVRLNQDIFSAKLAIQNGSNADFLNLSRIADECEQYAKEDDMYMRITTDCRFHLMLAEIGKKPGAYIVSADFVSKNLPAAGVQLCGSTGQLNQDQSSPPDHRRVDAKGRGQHDPCDRGTFKEILRTGNQRLCLYAVLL